MATGDLERVVEIQHRITRQEVSDRWKGMVAQHIGDQDRPGIVAESEGKVIGFIIGEIKVGHFGTDLSGWIENMGVTPEHMGAGVGRALVRGLFDHFKAQGIFQMFTAVRWDSGDMLAFFQKQGFDRSPFINLHLDKDKA